MISENFHQSIVAISRVGKKKIKDHQARARLDQSFRQRGIDLARPGKPSAHQLKGTRSREFVGTYLRKTHRPFIDRHQRKILRQGFARRDPEQPVLNVKVQSANERRKERRQQDHEHPQRGRQQLPTKSKGRDPSHWYF